MNIQSKTLGAAPTWPNSTRAWYATVLLMCAYTCSFIDRQVLSLLVGPIREDLQITDTEVSLLTGLAFSAFYTVMGIPMGRLVDSRRRNIIISVGIFFWSLMTALCGLAKSFWMLACARMGVGIGEATLAPAATSLIYDYFPRHKVAKPLSIYMMGMPIGSGMALILGGLVIDYASSAVDLTLPFVGTIRPWQVTFLLLGIPGILLAFLVLSIKEPVRRGIRYQKKDNGDLHSEDNVPVKKVLAFIFKENGKTFLPIFGGFALLAFYVYGLFAWIPSFFIRSYGLTELETGTMLGWLTVFAGVSGVYFGGAFTAFLQRRGHKDAPLKTIIFSTFGMAPCAILMPLSPTPLIAMILLAPLLFFLMAPAAVLPVILQSVTPNRMRGQTTAVYNVINNTVGLALGPMAVALITDFVFEDEMMVRYSLCIVAACILPCAVVALNLGRKPYQDSLKRAESWNKNV